MEFPLRGAFAALPLPEDARREFVALQERLAPFEDCLRMQKSDTPHLTVQYWREVLEIEYQPILDSLQRIANKHQSFSLHVTGPNTFRRHGADAVLFLEVAFSEELARIKKDCPWPSQHSFHPHITLARVRHAQRFAHNRHAILKALRQSSFSFRCTTLRLYAEIDGQPQTPLHDFPFADAC